MAEPASQIAKPLLTALRVGALLAVLGVHLVLVLPSVLRHLAEPEPWPQLVAFGVLSLILLGASVFMLRGRALPGWLVVPGALAALFASVLANTQLAAVEFFGAAHWSHLELGWFGVLLLLDRWSGYTVLFFAAHIALTVGQLLLAGSLSGPLAATMGVTAVATWGLSVTGALAVRLLRHCAARAAEVAEQRHRIDTERAVLDRVRAEQRERRAELTEVILPLLDSLADGTLDPLDERVRRRCSVEASRMRRKLAEADGPADQLVHELRACADLAERRGVAVDLVIRGAPSPIPIALRRALIDPAIQALAAANATARATVLRGRGAVRVSVVIDTSDVDIPDPAHPAVRVSTVVRDETLWVEARAAVYRQG